MSFTLCSSQAIVNKAGSNVSTAASTSGAIMVQFSDEAEAFVCAATKYDWITNYATYSSNSYAINTIADATACIAATSLVAYDMSDYPNITYAEDLINVLYDRAGRCIEHLQKLKMPKENL